MTYFTNSTAAKRAATTRTETAVMITLADQLFFRGTFHVLCFYLIFQTLKHVFSLLVWNAGYVDPSGDILLLLIAPVARGRDAQPATGRTSCSLFQSLRKLFERLEFRI